MTPIRFHTTWVYIDRLQDPDNNLLRHHDSRWAMTMDHPSAPCINVTHLHQVPPPTVLWFTIFIHLLLCNKRRVEGVDRIQRKLSPIDRVSERMAAIAELHRKCEDTPPNLARIGFRTSGPPPHRSSKNWLLSCRSQHASYIPDVLGEQQDLEGPRGRVARLGEFLLISGPKWIPNIPEV